MLTVWVFVAFVVGFLCGGEFAYRLTRAEFKRTGNVT